MRHGIFAVVLLAACTSSTAAVDLTISFDGTVGDDVVARVETFVIRASGDETVSFPISLGRAAMRSERIVYRPGTNTRSIGITIEAYSAQGELLATGMVSPVMFAKGAAVSLTVTLSLPIASGDMPPSDMAMSDMATSDMAKTPKTPMFTSVELVTANPGNSLELPQFAGQTAGDFLLAMVMVENNVDTTPVSITAPAGWMTLTSVSSATPTPATATWFWKFAANTDTPTYPFVRTNGYHSVATLMRYEGVNTNLSNPFDALVAVVAPNTVSTASIPTIQTTQVGDLLIGNAGCPDDFAAAFGVPASMIARQSGTILVADQVLGTAGDTNLRYLTPSTSGCRYFMFAAALAPAP
jgi:hypothetical protein